MQCSRLILLCGLLAAAGCAESTQTVAPTPAPPASLPSQPAVLPPAPPFPAPSRHAQIYVETGPLYAVFYKYHGSQLASRYVLFDDGTFVLQFSSLIGLSEYPGTTTSTGSEIRFLFLFQGANVAGWDAVGTLQGTSLRVVYNGVMIGADFENGVYSRSPGAP